MSHEEHVRNFFTKVNERIGTFALQLLVASGFNENSNSESKQFD
jgi:hypothetical protein